VQDECGLENDFVKQKLARLSDYLLLMDFAPDDQLLGSFADLRKGTISFVRFVCLSFLPSICPHAI